jgi:hypothetical protein
MKKVKMYNVRSLYLATKPHLTFDLKHLTSDIKKSFLLLILAVFFTSCSPEKRLHRLLALHPELVQNDTIRITDTTFLPELRIDTIVHESKLHDTITITKEKLTVRIHRLRDTIYIAAHQEPDTIIITKEIPVEKVIHKQPEPIHEKIWGYFRYNFLFSIFCIVILIAFILGISRR